MNHGAEEFIGEMVDKYPTIRGRILEIGSRDCGGTPRHWFTEGPDGVPVRYEHAVPTERFPSYTGIDIVQGNAVDRVMDAHHMEFADESFDIVISTSHMEHDSDPFQTMREVNRVLTSGGYFIFTAPSWRGQPHHCDHDYWRFTLEGAQLLLRIGNISELEMREREDCNDVMALGRKL